MSRLRNLFAVVGLATAAVGLVFIVNPGLARTVAVPDLAVTVIGGLAVLEGIRSALSRRSTDLEQADPPEVEARLERPAPGDEFDARVADLAGRRQTRWIGGDYDRVRRRLREAAIEALRAQGLTREAAEERIDAGSWTDDAVAAAFLSDEVSIPFRVELRLLFGREPRFTAHTTRTVDAITRLRGVSADDDA